VRQLFDGIRRKLNIPVKVGAQMSVPEDKPTTAVFTITVKSTVTVAASGMTAVKQTHS
jgi:hypothetical protein